MLLDAAHHLRRWLFRAVGWRTRGVRVVVFDGTGRVLLVRHRYGDQQAWYFPGGGLRWREQPDAGARREVREETGCTVATLEPAGVFTSTAEGWRDTVHLFRGVTTDVPKPDAREVAEARFFALDALPRPLSPATARRLDERVQTSRSADW